MNGNRTKKATTKTETKTLVSISRLFWKANEGQTPFSPDRFIAVKGPFLLVLN